MTKENIKTNTITTINMTKKKKRKQRITMVCSWIYTGYRKKKPYSWIEHEKRIHSDEKKKKEERKRESYCAHIKQ